MPLRHRLGLALLILSQVGAEAAAPLPGANGLELTEFAHEPLVRNAVAVTADEQGHIYVTSVVRRQAADLDIRRFHEWIETDLSLTSVEEKRAFFRRTLIPENSAAYVDRFEDTNGDGSYDWRDLNLLADQISRLDDSDDDGIADTVVKFNATENSEITGIAAGLASWDGALYATVEPDLLRLVDHDGDGIPDERTVLATGFSPHIGFGGHNFSGAIIGPDGRLYVAAADRGMNVTTIDGRNIPNPFSGAIARCELDGSGFELFATGLRNLQEPAFDDLGNMLGVDNDGDMRGEMERFVYVPEGSDAGWRTYWQYRGDDYQPWMAEGLSIPSHAEQPAYLLPPLQAYKDGPAGFAHNPGTALNPHYRDYFFMSAFPSRNLFAFKAEPDGAAFKMVDEHTVASGVLMTGISFAPDGALYLADWSSDGYDMNEKGAVWKLDDPRETGSKLRRTTAALIAGNWREKSSSTLPTFLGHPDQRVRMKAQFELVRRQQVHTLQEAAQDTDAPQLSRVHAIWGLGQLLRQGHIAPDSAQVALLRDPDPEIRAQTAKVLGEAKARPRNVEPALQQLLQDVADRPRFFAAIALGRSGTTSTVPALIDYLARDGLDPYHRHAAVMGLTGCARPAQLANLATHSSTAVRLGAVVALRRLHAADVITYLADTDPLIVAEAASAIYDDAPIDSALPALANLLTHPESHHERTLRRALGAAVHLRTSEHAAAVAALAVREDQPKTLRLLALDLLKTWPDPPRLDSVQGRFRVLPSVEAATVASAIESALTSLSVSTDFEIAEATWQTAATYQLLQDPSNLTAIIEQDAALAAIALKTLAELAPANLLALTRKALHSTRPNVRAEALRVLARHTPSEFGIAAASALADNRITEVRAALNELPTQPDAVATPLLRTALTRLQQGLLPPALALDVLESAEASTDSTVNSAVTAYQKTKDASNPLSPYIETLHGGDAERGRSVFRTSVAAQCTLCHRVWGEGSAVGPALAGIGAKSANYILESLIVPNAIVAPGYGFTTVTLKNGDSHSGTLVADTPAQIRLQLADDTTLDIDPKDIADRTPAMSSMPPMGWLMSKMELRDLLAYLQTL